MSEARARSISWRELFADLNKVYELPATENILSLFLYKIVYLSFLQEKGLFFDEKGGALTLLQIIKLLSARNVNFCTEMLFSVDEGENIASTYEKAGIHITPLTIKILNGLQAFGSCFVSLTNSEKIEFLEETFTNGRAIQFLLLLYEKYQGIIDDPEVLSFLFDRLLGFSSTRGHKIEKGVFFTPYPVARLMAKKSIEELVVARAREMFSGHWLSYDDFIKEAKPVQLKEVLDGIVKNLTVLDPAVGSGELLIASGEVLLDTQMKISSLLAEKTGPLDIAKSIVRENLFGVDLLPSAVQACRLRLFLFLTDQTDSLNNINPQDYPSSFTIKAGNSLIGSDFDEDAGGGINGKESDLHYYEHLQKQTGTAFKPEISGKLPLFHWNREFPFIKTAGGFDIIISNPPWGSRAKGTKLTSPEKEMLKFLYPAWGNNIYGAFIERFSIQGNILKPEGTSCFIVPDTLLTIRTLACLRELLLDKTIQEIILLGDGVFTDAPAMGSVVIRIINAAPGEKHTVMVLKRPTISDDGGGSPLSLSSTYRIQQEVWRQIKANRYIHGVSPRILSFFMKDSQIKTVCPLLGVVRQGLATGDNARFIRPLKGISPDQIGTKVLDFSSGHKKWAKIALGRFIRPYRLDIVKAVYWENNGEIIRKQRHQLTGRLKARVQNEKYYFKGRGISFKGLGEGNFCAAILPEGCIFSHTTHTVFLHEPESIISEFLLGYMNGFVARFFVDRCINTGKHVEVNDVAELPVIIPEKENLVKISNHVKEAIAASAEDRVKDLQSIQREIDQLLLGVFGLLPEDFAECYSVQLADLKNR